MHIKYGLFVLWRFVWNLTTIARLGNSQVTRYALKHLTNISCFQKLCALNTVCRRSCFSPFYSVLVSSGNSVFCCAVSEKWIPVCYEWVCSGQLWLSIVELCVKICCEGIHILGIQKKFVSNSTDQSLLPSNTAQETWMISLMSTAQPVQQLCPRCWFTLLLEL